MAKLFSGRKRERERQEAEARGENLWVTEFSLAVRAKVLLALRDSCYRSAVVMERAQGLLIRDEGRLQLTEAARALPPDEDFITYYQHSDTDGFASCVEALLRGLEDNRRADRGMGDYGLNYEPERFRDKVREILATERAAWDLINGDMVPFESREMHVEVVAPVLTLLGGDVRFAAAETAYQKALKEIAVDAGDAITDAARALQEMLTALGCEGNALGPLLTSAKKKGLLGPHDYKLIDWVSADRSEMGDAHKEGAPVRHDAWLAVHIVGALILRLAGGPRV